MQKLISIPTTDLSATKKMLCIRKLRRYIILEAKKQTLIGDCLRYHISQGEYDRIEILTCVNLTYRLAEYSTENSRCLICEEEIIPGKTYISATTYAPGTSEMIEFAAFCGLECREKWMRKQLR